LGVNAFLKSNIFRTHLSNSFIDFGRIINHWRILWYRNWVWIGFVLALRGVFGRENGFVFGFELARLC
jgi:hypothetical protein